MEELRGCLSSSTTLLHPRDTQGAEQQQQFSAKHFVPVGKARCTLSQLHPRTAPMVSGMGSSCGPHPIPKGAPILFIYFFLRFPQNKSSSQLQQSPLLLQGLLTRAVCFAAGKAGCWKLPGEGLCEHGDYKEG